MTPIMKTCRLQMTHHVKTAQKMLEIWAMHAEMKLINTKVELSGVSQPSCLIIMRLGEQTGLKKHTEVQEMSTVIVN